MDLNDFIDMSVEDALSLIKSSESIVNYSKVEATEFIEIPEQGYYLQSNDGLSRITEYRIYFEQSGEFFPSSDSLRGRYSNLLTMSDAEDFFGTAIREIKSIKMPGSEPTMPGKAFQDKSSKIIAYTKDGIKITCLHRKPL